MSEQPTSSTPFQKIFQSSSMAVLLSLGLHGLLLGVVLPHLGTQEKQSQQKDNVPVIELSATEQARLPLLLQSEDDLTTYVNPSPLIASSSDSLPLPPPQPIIPNNDLATLPEVPSLPILPPPPPLIASPPPVIENPSPSQPETLSDVEESPPPPVLSTQAEDLLDGNTSDIPQPPPETAATSTPVITQPIPEKDRQDLIALRQEKLLASLRDRTKKLQKDTTNTTDEEATKNYLAWLNKIQVEKPPEFNLTAKYPKDACIKKIEGTSVYGVLVSEGKATERELIKSAGYPIFNELAIEEIKAKTFDNQENQSNPTHVLVKVEFKYDSEICPSLSIP